MPEPSAHWLRWVFGMGERRKLGDVALDLLLFAGMVCSHLRKYAIHVSC